MGSEMCIRDSFQRSCSQSRLLSHLEAYSKRLVQQQDGRAVVFVYSAIHPAGDGLLSAVSDDQRYRRQRHSSLSGSLALCCIQTPVVCDGELEPDSICHIQPVQVGMTSLLPSLRPHAPPLMLSLLPNPSVFLILSHFVVFQPFSAFLPFPSSHFSSPGSAPNPV